MSGVVGPTMVSMEILLGVSTSQIGLVLVFSSVGYTSGSILGGRSKLSVYNNLHNYNSLDMESVRNCI